MHLIWSPGNCVVGSALTAGMIGEMMKEMPALINENDLHVSQVLVIVYNTPCCIMFHF